MKTSVQTFTIRKYMQHEEDVKSSLRQLEQMGIKYLELAYVKWNLDFMKMVKKHMDFHNLKALSSQIKLRTIMHEYQEIIAIHKLLKIKYMAVSIIPFWALAFGNYGLTKFAEKLNSLGKSLKEHNIQLLFHHHNYEFRTIKGNMALDILIEKLNPEFCAILSDTYWIRRGGFDVVEFLEERKSHIKALHLRGHNNKVDTNLVDSDFDSKKVLSFAKKHNFYYGSIEQNTNEPFMEIETSFKHLLSFEESE